MVVPGSDFLGDLGKPFHGPARLSSHMYATTSEARLNGDAERSDADRAPTVPESDLGSVFDADAPGLYRTILAFTGGRGDVAEEAVAEAFARAAAHTGELRDPVAWLYRVAFNVATDELRRERRQRTSPAPTASPPPEVSGLMDALKKLPPRQRAAIVLFHVGDLPVAEVAQRMGIAQPTVRVHLVRGRRRLGELLGEDE
jgi:RNA polymerase sigma-70 factor (ECF subfamily)